MPHEKPNPLAVLKLPEVQCFLAAGALSTLANRGVVVVIGFQIYQLTKSALALGWLGLVEAIPAISLSLFGGYVADHFNRRTILLNTRAVSIICAVLLAIISNNSEPNVLALYSVIFLAGIARGFADPAATAFEAQVVPRELTVNASSWIGSTWLSCSIIGPVLAGFACAWWGPVVTYLVVSFLFCLSWICLLGIKPKPQPDAGKSESIFHSISLGLKFVFSEQILVGAMPNP